MVPSTISLPCSANQLSPAVGFLATSIAGSSRSQSTPSTPSSSKPVLCKFGNGSARAQQISGRMSNSSHLSRLSMAYSNKVSRVSKYCKKFIF
ncbi:hypothetical protein I7I50_00446 [Histoplasma capsulatum G186AR]|uniref:Uncharacterized protein n=1 Tax=Ajellomyces capsulatus TaxID=5037 RepID=A0A8H7YGD5_AJECA|nr:hypothetical protein I7I52_07714 [Histoplasma capsulatum]QSS72564.1 hypothetical protein I7I50_00446 [Histoplasma capsulatum G186AR]